MDAHEAEVRGRAVAHYLYEELEKIAAVRVSSLTGAARKVTQEAADTNQALGARRWIPGTAAWRASSAANRRARMASRNVDKSLLRKRRDAETLLGTGTSSDRAKARQVLQELDQAKGPKSRAAAAARDARRRLGIAPAPPAKPKSKGLAAIVQSPMARQAALPVAAGIAGAGTLYAGQQYLSQQKQPGYGGY